MRASQSKKILVVDDMSSVRMLLRQILTEKQFSVEEAADGKEALSRIRASPPDLVIMDILMPKMDGIECCRRIKSDATTKNIPVIIMTPIRNYEQAKEAAVAGCDSYLQKPIRKERVLGKIWLLLRLSGS